MSRRYVLGLAFMLFATSILSAQPRKYPAINTATIWEVDAKWPQKPADLQWAAMSGIAVDAKDNVYLLTRTSEPVQVFDATGKFVRSWRGELERPHQIRFDREGNLWITDIDRHIVQRYTPEGKLLTTLGVKDKPGREEGYLNMPTDVAFGPKGEIYVSDGYGNARIVQFDAAGKVVRMWGGELGAGPGQFSIPHSIACDSKGKVYVADRNNARIQIFDGQGKYLDEWRNLCIPWGLSMSDNDELWVCGSSIMQWRKEDTDLGCPPKDQLVMRFNTSGKLLHLWTVPKGMTGLERPGEVNWVHCIALDSSGNIYLGDIHGRRAQKFNLRTPTK